MHPPEREINFGCPFGQKILGRKLDPVAKFTRCKLWVPGQKVPYLLGMKQIYISSGATLFYVAFISSTSDEETFWKQTIMTVAL